MNILKNNFGPKLKENISLSSYTTIQLGGRAKYFIEVEGVAELKDTLLKSIRSQIPYFILGGGTNTLIKDERFAGLVIRNKSGNIKIVGFRGSFRDNKSNIKDIYLEVDSGVLVNRLVRFCLEESFAGLENFFHQPGTVGGAVYINAHNIGQNDYFGSHIFEAKLITKEGKEKKVDRSYFKFGYDSSTIQKTKDIVLSVSLKLQKGEKNSLWQKASLVAEYRKSSQPQGVRSLGCTFRNITKEEAFRLHTPSYTQSSGYLIESAGLKGYQIGKSRFSTKHANFIEHLGGGHASDVLQLIALAKEKIKSKFGVDLKEEIVII
ncbi:UDP-N-acetylmuramate dehydrogenase [Candidatus Gottesmanbacteria bacterium]|nr:UDP-N-acetylmuramate dehydrogenase [Candidatus Gottesmanbacteria bacterium]